MEGTKTVRNAYKRILATFLCMLLTISCLGQMTVYDVQAATISGIKPVGGTAYVYDLGMDGYFPETVLWPGDSLTYKPVNSIGKDNKYRGCNSAECPSAGTVYTYAYGLALTGDTDVFTVTTEKIEYYKLTNGKKTTATIDVIKKLTVKKGPVLVKGTEGQIKKQLDIFCKHNQNVETYYYGFAYPIEAKYYDLSTFNVSYDYNGGVMNGKDTNPTQIYFSNKNYKQDLNAPVKLGYELSWTDVNKNQPSFIRVNKDSISVDALKSSYDLEDAKNLVEKGGLKLKAKWTECDVNITYDYGFDKWFEGDGTRTGHETVKATEKDRLSRNLMQYVEEPQRDGYKFMGWYMDDTKITCLNDIPSKYWNKKNSYTLSAKWEKVEEVKPEPEPKPQEPEPIEIDEKTYEPDVEFFSIEEIMAGFEDSRLVYSGEGNGNKVEGLVYNQDKNVLEINNYEGTAIFTTAMGSSFTVDVEGKNNVEQVYSYANDYNGTIHITGNGSLSINTAQERNGILIKACGTNSQLIIDEGVDLSISSGKNAIRVEKTTNPNPIKLTGSAKLEGAEIVITEAGEVNSKGEKLYNAEVNAKTCKISGSKASTVKAPAKAKISKTTVNGKTATLTWKKVSGADGYEVRYSTKKNMSGAKKVSVTFTQKKITSLKKGKTYYVQVCAYKVAADGSKVYGSWSAKKAVKIK